VPASVDLHGDPLPNRALARLGTARFRLGYPTRSIQCVPARKQIVTNHLDGMLALWNADSGQLMRLEDEGHSAFAVSHDGKTFASARLDAIRLWDGAAASDSHFLLRGPLPPVSRLAFSHDDRFLAAVDENSVWVWEVSSGKLLRQHVGMLAAEFDPTEDGLFVADQDGLVEHWDVQQDIRLNGFTMSGSGKLTCLGVSSDGKTLLANRGRDVGAMDLKNGRVVCWMMGHDLPVGRILVSPAGDTAITRGTDHSISFWRLFTGALIGRIDAHAECMAISSDGKSLISGGGHGNLRFWDLVDFREHLRFSDMSRQLSASFAGADRVWTGGIDGRLRQWNADNGHLMATVALGMPSYGVAASPRDGSVLVAREDGEIQDFRPGSAQLTHLTHHQARALCVGVAPDGDLFATGGEDRMVFIGRRSSRHTLFRLEGHHGPVKSLGFSPDGRFLASAGGEGDGALCFWSTSSGALMERAEIGAPLDSLVYVSSGQRIVVIAGDDVVLWSIPEHKIERRLGVIGATAVAVSPCGRLMALGHTNGTVRVLKRGAEKLVWQTDGHHGRVTSLAYSPDGSRLVSTGDDAVAIVWQA
jgi:WD40 repeat protein